MPSQKQNTLTNKQIVEDKYRFRCSLDRVKQDLPESKPNNKKTNVKPVGNYGLRSIILALNNMENEILKQEAVEDHK